MGLSPSRQTANSAAIQEFTKILWNPKVHYRVRKSPPLTRILSQINPVHETPSSLRSIFISSIRLRLGLPSGLFPSGFPTKIRYAFRFAPIRTTCSAHLTLLNLIILIILGEEYKFWSFLQRSITSSLFGPNIHLSTLFSDTLSLCSLMPETEFHTHTESQTKLQFCLF
jgi:hypothetical protein